MVAGNHMATERQCFWLTKNLRRCGRIGPWMLFCSDHKFRPPLALATLVLFILSVVADLSGIANLFGWLPPLSQPKPSSITVPMPQPPTEPKKEPEKTGTPDHPPVKSSIEREIKSIFVDCRSEALPPTFPESGGVSHIYILNPREHPWGGGGLTDYFAAPGGKTGWAINPKLGYKCEVANYSARVLFNVEAELLITFLQALTVADTPKARAQGPMTLRRPWILSITKLDIGPAGSFVFYVHNNTNERFIQIQFPEYAAGTLHGDASPSKISITQSEPSRYVMLNPISLDLHFN